MKHSDKKIDDFISISFGKNCFVSPEFVLETLFNRFKELKFLNNTDGKRKILKQFNRNGIMIEKDLGKRQVSQSLSERWTKWCLFLFIFND